jgi:hypothetical protein
MVRYTVDRPTPKSSAISGAEVVQLQQMFCLVRLQLRPLAAQPTRYFHRFPGAPSDQISLELRHHRQHIEQQPPTGSVGSWIDPPRLSLTFLFVSSSRMSRASGSDRASRSSLVTTNVSPALGTPLGPTEARVGLG